MMLVRGIRRKKAVRVRERKRTVRVRESTRLMIEIMIVTIVRVRGSRVLNKRARLTKRMMMMTVQQKKNKR